MQDASFLDFAARELEKIGLIDRDDVLDGTVVRVPKAYPAYFGEYQNIGRVRSWLDGIQNLYPVGRNGMHCYNNQDHSMLAAKAAVDCIAQGSLDKSSLWSINAEEEYHETRVDAGCKAVQHDHEGMNWRDGAVRGHGVLCVALKVVIVILLTEYLGIHYLVSVAICTATIAVVGYVLNKAWTFHRHGYGDCPGVPSLCTDDAGQHGHWPCVLRMARRIPARSRISLPWLS